MPVSTQITKNLSKLKTLTNGSENNEDDQTFILGEIDSHSVVQFGHDVDACLYIFGGYIEGNVLSNIVFKVNFALGRKSNLTMDIDEVFINSDESPTARCILSAAAVGDSFYIFGGKLEAGRTNEIWKFDTTENTW